jgi:DNA polymerase-1
VDGSRVVLAVDGNSLVHRSFHALAATGLRSVSGEPMWAVRGLLSQLVAAVDRIGPVAVVVGFDDAAKSLRRDRWPAYKAQRIEKLPTLVRQLELAAEVLAALGVHVVIPCGLEADDVLASVAHQARLGGARTVIMTSDRDAFALIDDATSVLRIINGGVEASPVLTPQRLVTLLGVRADQYRDYAALRGDPSDNLPGVPGFGPKTAAALLASLGSVRAAFDDLAGDGATVRAAVGTRRAAALADRSGRERYELNCAVMAGHRDLELGFHPVAGPGLLPLPDAVVRAVFGEHRLVSTLPAALRALAHVEVAAADPVYATASYSPDGYADAGRPELDQPDPGGPDRGRARWSGRRYGKLPPKRPDPLEHQLALF